MYNVQVGNLISQLARDTCRLTAEFDWRQVHKIMLKMRVSKKHNQLTNMYKFIPIAIETLGAMGPKTRDFIKSLGKRITRQTGDQREAFFLTQRLSVAVQQGNSASVLGTLC